MLNKNKFLFEEAYKKIFNAYNQTKKVLKENFYINDNNEIIFDDNQDDDQTLIGSPSVKASLQGYTLVGKFDGNNTPISGDYSGPYTDRYNRTNNSTFFVGYRVTPEKNKRIAVMASVKGTANYTLQDRDQYLTVRDNPKKHVPAAKPQELQKDDSLYGKDFYGLSDVEYKTLIDKAINAFITTNRNIKYDYIIIPSGRSRNALHIANALKLVVGTPEAQVTTLNKIRIDNNQSFYNIFRMGELLRKFERFFPNVDSAIIERGIKDFLQDYARKHQGQEVSTATHTRSTSLKTIYNFMYDRLTYIQDLNIPRDNRGPGGHLDAFADSHLNPQEVEDLIQQITHRQRQQFSSIHQKNVEDEKELRDKSDKEIQDYRDKLNEIPIVISNLEKERKILGKELGLGYHRETGTEYNNIPTKSRFTKLEHDKQMQKLLKLHAKEKEKKEELRHLRSNPLRPRVPVEEYQLAMRSTSQANLNLLFVDDNINSGDMYKQMLGVVQYASKITNKIQFFFLLCKQTYAPTTDIDRAAVEAERAARAAARAANQNAGNDDEDDNNE